MTTSPLKVEDSRAQFEAWHNSTHRWKVTPTMRTDDGYTNNIQASNGWAAWQASRAAIVVELPKPMLSQGETDANHDYMAMGFGMCLGICKSKVLAAGITVKGEG
jgi:hypothetical protein